MKCQRCGGCCLASPCMFITIGQEKFVKINRLRVHKCPHLTFDKDKAICNVMAKIHVTGECSSLHHSEYTNYLAVKDKL
jgi:hypothetical protein